MRILFIVSLVLLSLNYDQILAQDSDSLKENSVMKLIVLNDGTQRKGYVISDDGREILFDDLGIGKIYIKKHDVKSITIIQNKLIKDSNGNSFYPGVFNSRYCLSTNALPVEKGNHYAAINLYGPEVHLAAAKNLSIGVMTTWAAAPIAAVAKYTIPTNSRFVHFGIGTMFGSSSWINTFSGYGGLYWGMLTLGNERSNITFSAGYSHVSPKFNSNNGVPAEGVYYPVGEYYEGDPYYDLIWQGNSGSSDKFISAPVVGLAGVTKLNEKIGFVFDGMVFFANSTESQISFVETPLDEFNEFGNAIRIEEKITEVKNSNVALIAQIGMRVQQRENMAFQVSLGTVYASANENRGAMGFPIANCTWFFKF
jgi:hypothetical protein